MSISQIGDLELEVSKTGDLTSQQLNELSKLPDDYYNIFIKPQKGDDEPIITTPYKKKNIAETIKEIIPRRYNTKCKIIITA